MLSICIALVCLAAMGVLGLSLWLPIEAVEWAWWGALGLFVCILFSEAGHIELSQASSAGKRGSYVVSVATIPHLAAALLLPPVVAAVLAGIAMLLDELRGRSPLPRLVFNVAGTTLSVGVAALEASFLGIAGERLAIDDWHIVLGFFLVAATYYLVNTLPVVAISTIASGGSFWRLIGTNARYSAPAEFAVAVVGGLAAHEWVHGPFWVVVGIFPAVISHLALRSIGARNRKADQISSLDRLGRALAKAFTVEQVFKAASAHLLDSGALGCFVELAEPPTRLAAGVGPATGTEWLVTPLTSGSRGNGSLGIAPSADKSGKDDREVLGLVAERIALALENARHADELAQMAFHDALTGLPNRAQLADRIELALRTGIRDSTPVALLFLDLDRFKEINDTFGHRFGDLALQEIGRRLTDEMPESVTLARLSGDEFAILLPGASAQQAGHFAERLLRALQRSLHVQDVTLDVSASIGIAVAPEHGKDADLLQRRADIAMYVAKQRRGEYALYSTDQDEHSREQLELAADLRRAVERAELVLHYQPIVSLETGRMEEIEALVRWHHPERGLISPVVFIPLAEETGMILPIGRWVLEEACRQAVAWRAAYPQTGSLVMSVNLSSRQFQHTDVAADVAEVLRKTGMDPHFLKLEITESIAMGNAELTIAALWLLQGMGIRMAIDDFGTGYSSLAYLKRFPVETLKIDKAFVDGLGVHPEDAAVIAAIIAFARAVDLTTTAEGVETAEQLAQIRALGADRVQGYYYSRPLAAEALEALLRAPRQLHLQQTEQLSLAA
jgi:diguanylate cyclase (GGDEF)-like protein